jgi:hypothetical protein
MGTMIINIHQLCTKNIEIQQQTNSAFAEDFPHDEA